MELTKNSVIIAVMSNGHFPNVINIHETSIEKHLDRIRQEFQRGFEFAQKYPRSVSIFGSSMITSDNIFYKHAYELSKKIVAETKYAVFNGGGPGIMEASSKGATEAGGQSVGMRINLLRERNPNNYATDTINFTYFFARKSMLTFAAETYIFFPGGFGTFDEMFGILTLIQTSKIPRVPVILFGSSFWNPFRDFLKQTMLSEHRMINDCDLDIFEITDNYDHIIDIIKKAPTSEWWKNIN